MFSPLRNRFGIPGVISVIALVFAMMGGAYAATDNGGKATASAKAKKGPRGPKGPAGPAGAVGPAGAQGPAGPTGPKGDTGAAGSNGTNGIDGTNGSTVLGGAAIPISQGKIGDFYIRTTTSDIYGPKTAGGWGSPTSLKGAQGSPWAAGGTLPPGSTETGAWVGLTNEAGIDYAAISFTIPLAASLDENHVVILPAGGEGELGKCSDKAETTKGTAVNPLASPGYLCVYTTLEEASASSSTYKAGVLETGAGKTGAILPVEGAKNTEAFGTWAVTAP